MQKLDSSDKQASATPKQLAYQAIDKWGEVQQMRQAGEECIELALAVRHFERGKVDWDAVATEVADVEMALEQLRQMVPVGLLSAAREKQRAKLAALLGVPS